MRIRTAFALLAAAPAALAAQTPAPAPQQGEELVDRVVAVVGDTSLLLSDVQEEVAQMRAAGRPVPADPQGQAEMVQQIVQTRVNDLVALQAARLAGVTVGDDEVGRTVDQEIREIRGRFPSEEAFNAALAQSGLTQAEFRANRLEQTRSRMMVARFISQRVGSAVRPVVSDVEIQAAFEAQRAQLGTRPATVSFEQVIVEPVASDSAKAAARREAEQVLEELRKGGDFEVLARRFSDDPGSKERGGDLGWFKQGQMVRPFEQVAFAMRPGDVSGIVETQFGFHIIKLEKARAGERQARHVLIRPEVTDADRARSRERADSVLAAARAGADMNTLAERYNTPADQRFAEDVPLDRLPAAYAPVMQDAAPGSILGPVQVEGGTNGVGWVILKVNERRAAGEYTLDEFREQVRESIQQQKIQQQVLEELLRSTYVRVNL
ncbi:MAG TPA: peptidylprolyl isomerase [Longimicrobiaceae bacterium]|jgi:peptidyl-prolyl cis-trans isomerase SurA|nr:peptidylprolyl isomerase [Longimicrobiaceae bacterium]